MRLRQPITAAILLLALPMGRSQTSTAIAGPDPLAAKKQELANAMKNNGGAAAAAVARANVDNGKARHADLQVADQLRDTTFELASQRHDRTVEAALTAIAEGEKAKGKITAADEVALNAENGRIYEVIIGDFPKAKLSYQAALRMNPAHKEAAAGLSRIQNAERRAAEKAQENETMRLRRQSQGPRS